MGADRDAERARSERLELQIGALLEQVTALTQKVAELTERLGQNSRNSHLPPSSDPPGTTGKTGSGQRPKSKRPRGASTPTRSPTSSTCTQRSVRTAGRRFPSSPTRTRSGTSGSRCRRSGRTSRRCGATRWAVRGRGRSARCGGRALPDGSGTPPTRRPTSSVKDIATTRCTIYSPAIVSDATPVPVRRGLM